MGSANSKTISEIKDELYENPVPSAPILTPQIRRLELDPRSPSVDIARTPIEVFKTPASTADNSLNIVEDLGDDIDEEIPKNCTNIDPRSPTTEFHRTPLIIENIPKELPLRNKNLERVLMPTVTITPIKPKRISERVIRKIYEPVKVVAPKLLESSPITVTFPENKRNSVVGLLETNIDFVETDLDAVIQSKISNKHEPSLDDENISSSASDGSAKSSMDSLDNIVDTVKISNSDNETDKDDETENNSALNVSLDEEKPKDITPEEYNEVFEQKASISVDELNRKLTNLIYEDKQCEASPKASKPIVTTNRTPLSDRNANGPQRRSIPVLKVSDKPKRLSASKIPIYKEKKGKNKINIQCENTPPRMKAKHSQWGAEDSIII